MFMLSEFHVDNVLIIVVNVITMPCRHLMKMPLSSQKTVKIIIPFMNIFVFICTLTYMFKTKEMIFARLAE